MKAAELLHELRDRGMILSLVEDRLCCDGPVALVRRRLLADLKRREPELIRRLQDEAEAQALAEAVGVMMLHWHQRVRRWSNHKHRRRRDRLLAAMARLDAALIRTGDPLEVYGWTVGPQGIWRRVGRREMRSRL
jgi:hypothetical protein